MYLRYLWHQVRQTFAKRRKDASFRLEGHIQCCVELARLPMGSHILCVGPRNHVELDIWRRWGYAPVGLDLLPSPGIRLGDFHALPFGSNTFDLVFASHAYEHAYNAHAALAEAVRVLKPGRFLFAAFPVGLKV